MTSLHSAWSRICMEASPLEDLPSPRWSRPWSTHPRAASRLYQTVQWRKPRILVETGTLEGLGTYTLAKAAEANGGGKIFTLDYDGDPETSIPAAEWANLRAIRRENLETARRTFPHVEIVFLEGDSRQLLPELVKGPARGWEIFFQDSMHYFEGMDAEWGIMEPAAGAGAVAIFDDACLDWRKLPAHWAGRKDFCLAFVLRQFLARRWQWRSTSEGRGQFFAARRP